MSTQSEASASSPISNGVRSTVELNYSDDEDEVKLPSFVKVFERNVAYIYDQICKIFEGPGRTSKSTFVTSLCVTIVVIYLVR